MTRFLKALAAALALACLASCAAVNDGGIVGTGNRLDCERTPNAEGCPRPDRPDRSDVPR